MPDDVAAFAAGLAQIASTGIHLSALLCDSASAAPPSEQDLADIADHLKTTAIAFDSVAKLVAQEDGPHDLSKTALSEAGDLAKRCEFVFSDVHDFIAKRNDPGQDDSKSARAQEQWKEQRTELLRRRLDSLKHSILLLLHVLQLADAQAKGKLDDSLIAQERDTIRQLHQRQQDSIKALQEIETNLGDVVFSDDETLNGSAAPSRVPTINFLVHSSARDVSSDAKAPGYDRSTAQTTSALSDKPETSDSDNSDETVTDDDEDLTVDELAHCANYVQKLLKRITALQQADNVRSSGRSPRNKVLRSYRRFCRKFEAAMSPHHGATTSVAPLPNAVSPYQHNQQAQPHGPAHNSQTPTQHHPTASSASFSTAHGLSQSPNQQHHTRALKPVVDTQYATAPPAWTISSEPLGPGGRPKLPPLISSVPAVTRASHASPTNDLMSPADDHDGRHSGTDDGEHGSHETGPVVYTKTGRISKAKKGLKVHVCEECGRSFTRAEHLRRHQKNHGPNQVRCELCGKVFFRADLLQRHLERHKDLPQSYRFSNAPNAEGASPVADNQHHRHILPTPESVRHVIPQHHSPSGRSVNSNGVTSAPNSSEVPAASPAVTSRPHSAWDTPKTQAAVSHTSDEMPSQRQHSWQAVNAPERRHYDTPALQPGLPKLQPKADTANGASTQKRYSNILPAPGQDAHPQEHMPNMLPSHHPVHPVQATGGSAIRHDAHQTNHNQLAAVSQASPSRQDRHVISPSSATSTTSTSAYPSYPDQSHASRSFPVNATDSGKIASDKEGVNWRLAETDAQSHRKRKYHRSMSQIDGEPNAIDDRSGYVPPRTSSILHRSRSGSRSLSLVTPQDDRDHALLGTSRPENRQVAELISPHGGPVTTLSPSVADRRSASRPSTGVSEPATVYAGKATSRPESPEPESPYSLATINRYIQNQGPQPGVPDATSDSASSQISLNPCERCREYSIKCDGKLPSCTACATTKYAGECSFARPKFYENVPTMTRPATTMGSDTATHLLQPPAASSYQRGQDYNSEEDLPSPYLKPRDKGPSLAHVPSTSLEPGNETQASRKRKADGATKEATDGGAVHERKKSKGEHAEPGKGKDIVDMLLKEWTVPVS